MAKKLNENGHVLKESCHTTEDKIKGNTHIYINKTQTNTINIFRKRIELGNMKNLILIPLPKAISKSAILFDKFAIKVNEMVCDILKYGYRLPFLCTHSIPEFSNSYSALKNSELADNSIKQMLRAGTIKQSLTKPKVINPISVSRKEKRG